MGDLFAYSGYIFICVVLNLLVGIFFVRSVRDVVLIPGGGVGDKRRQIFLVGIVVTQILVAWFLGSLADWSSTHQDQMFNAIRNVAVEGVDGDEGDGYMVDAAVY